jgi:hypothetical protein
VDDEIPERFQVLLSCGHFVIYSIVLQVYLSIFGKVSAVVASIGLILVKFDVHTSIHVLGFLLASLLVVVSFNSYYRERSVKVLFLAIAFILLDVHQLMELFESLGTFDVNTPIPLLGIELIHTVSFATVVFLAAGLLKKD